MKLTAVLTLKMKKGIIPQFIATLYKQQMEINQMNLTDSDGKWDGYVIEIIYSSKKDLVRVIDALKKNTEYFRDLTITSTLEDKIRGGLLLTQGKIDTDNNNDIETALIGGARLIHEKIEAGIGRQYCSVSNSIGLISGFKKLSVPTNEFYHYLADSERDSIIISRFTGKNSYPVAIKYQSVEDMIKTVKGIEENFACLRFMNCDEEDLVYPASIIDSLTRPVIFHKVDEVPLYLLSVIMRICRTHRYKPEETSVGIIGIDISIVRLTALLCGAGYLKVLGYDNRERTMMSFESHGGLATTPENVIDNADILIVFEQPVLSANIRYVRPGQIIISGLTGEMSAISSLLDKGVKEIIQMNEPDLLSLIPPVVNGITSGESRWFTDESLIRIAATVSKEFVEDYRLPGFFSEASGRIEAAITRG